MRKAMIVFFLIVSLFIASCTTTDMISNFDECAAAGNAIRETYPRQCASGGRVFTEDINNAETAHRLTFEEALVIAGNSECSDKGYLTNQYIFNENSNTWWIQLEMRSAYANPQCNPACVVNDINKTAEINWRCTGVVVE